MRKTRYTYTEEQLKEAVKNSCSIAQTLRYLGLNAVGQAYRIINRRIKENNIDTSHFTGQLWSKGKKFEPRPHLILSDILEGKHPGYSSHKLKKRLIREGIFEYKCCRCQNTEWNGEPIPLELEHIDGDHDNNKLNNLSILCPNCHAQTKTYRGKNIKSTPRKRSAIKNPELLNSNRITKKEKKRQDMLDSGNYCIGATGKLFPKTYLKIYCTKEEMERLVWEMPMTKIAKLFDVSGNAIRKFCKRYGINTPPIGYWIKEKALN